MKFKIIPHGPMDKSFVITGPGDLVLDVDYDDVDHEEVDRWAFWIVETLNRKLDENGA